VLEDDEGIRRAVAEVLTRAGAVVKTADSAATGMAMFLQFHPHVLVCDIAMPVEDGYEFIRKIRTLSTANGGDTPAVALTALAGEQNRRRALSEGFQMYLVKPIEMGDLASAIVSVLEGGPAEAKPLAQEKRSDATT